MKIEPVHDDQLSVTITPMESVAGCEGAAHHGDTQAIDFFSELEAQFADFAGVTIDNIPEDHPLAAKHLISFICSPDDVRKINEYITETDGLHVGKKPEPGPFLPRLRRHQAALKAYPGHLYSVE